MDVHALAGKTGLCWRRLDALAAGVAEPTLDEVLRIYPALDFPPAYFFAPDFRVKILKVWWRHPPCMD